MKADQTKRRRRGPIPLSLTEKRDHTVSVRLNASELERLDSLRNRVSMQRGEYLRAAALHRLPPAIPEINHQAWAELARVAGNFNQIVRHLNQGLSSELSQTEILKIFDLVQALRNELIGVKHES